MLQIKQLVYLPPSPPPRKRAAAYARVSSDTPQLLHSLAQQIAYFSALIQSDPRWDYAGVYADEAVSGVDTAHRKGFQRLLADCDAGKIDLVLVKSISRFARNTVDLLRTVRHLKARGIEVWFDAQRLSSLSAGGELMLTLLASFAQAEVESLSENSRWAIRKGFANGQPNTHRRLLGYRWAGDCLVIDAREAEAIRKIFADFLAGKPRSQSARELTAQGFASIHGNPLRSGSLAFILANPTYTGCLLLQKTYIESPFTHKKRQNRGELPQYQVSGSHEAIIPPAVFAQVQARLAANQRPGPCHNNRAAAHSPFANKIQCGQCGQNYTRQFWKSGGVPHPTWVCARKHSEGPSGCCAQNIPEKKLLEITAAALGLAAFDGIAFEKAVEKIIVDDSHHLLYCRKDGGAIRQFWCKDGVKNRFRDPCYQAQNRRALAHARACKKSAGPLTGRVRCECCGLPFRRQVRLIGGVKTPLWQCSAKGGCPNGFVLNSRLEGLLAAALEAPSFDGTLCAAGIDHVGVAGPGRLHIYKRDGAVCHVRFTPTPQELRQRPYQAKPRRQGKPGHGKEGTADGSGC